jgi:hypothetical protein
MRRLILLIAVGLVVFWIIRRAGAKKVPAGRGDGLPGSPPKSLVCGSCGFEFDPEVSGWICPKCHK